MQTLFAEDQVHSVAFNTAHESMVAYSGPTTLSIRTASFKPYRQSMSTTVIGFQGSKLFCLDGSQLREEDVPLSSTVQQYIGARQWQQAYEVACLGVTQQDWVTLGQAALSNLELDTARKAFVRTQDLLMLNLIHRMDIEVKSGVTADVLKAEALAHQVCDHQVSLSFCSFFGAGMMLHVHHKPGSDNMSWSNAPSERFGNAMCMCCQFAQNVAAVCIDPCHLRPTIINRSALRHSQG